MKKLYSMTSAIWMVMVFSVPANAGGYQFYGPGGQYQGSMRSNSGINAQIPLMGRRVTVPDYGAIAARNQQLILQRQQIQLQQQQLQKQQPQQQQQRQQTAIQQQNYVFNMAVKKLFALAESQKEKYPDFQAVVSNPKLAFTQSMIIVLAESKHGADIAYRLGKNPAKTARIASLPPSLQGREITVMDFNFKKK